MKALPFKIQYTTEESFLVQEDLKPFLYRSLHTHPEIQITLMLESSGTLFAGDYIGEFSPGDLFILGSNIPHVFKNEEDYFSNNSTKKAHAITIFLGTSLLENKLFNLPEAEDFTQFLNLAKKGLRAREVDFEKIRKKFINIKGKEGLQKLILLLEIIQEFSRFKYFEPLTKHQFINPVKEIDGKRLNDIFDFTLNEYYRTISLEEIADVANMTPQSFCRFFKQRTGKTYVSLLNEIRINKAAQMLKDMDKSVANISYMTGFNNLSHFNRQFKKIKGVAPSVYRNDHERILIEYSATR